MTWSSFLLGILAAAVAEELFGWSDRFSRWLMVHSARQLPMDLSERYEREWLQELAELPRFSRLLFSLDLIRGAYAIRHAAMLPGVSAVAPLVVRSVDIAIASSFLVAAAPLMLLASVALKFELAMRGPVLERDRRIGYLGKPFDVLRFRTFSGDMSGLSRIGRALRATRVDELPQLLNVLRGDMSLVGPRPERPELAEHLGALVPRYSERNRVRPGITGLAQLDGSRGKSNDDYRKTLAQDHEFIATYSVRRYLRILYRTIVIVLYFGGEDGRR